MTEALILDAVRTPRGKGSTKGALHAVRPVDLLGELYAALQDRVRLDPAEVDEVVIGCVTQRGDQGANVAKVSAMWAGLPESVSGTTVNRACASGLEAMRIAALAVRAGESDLVLAGGVESMSRVPMFSDEGAWFADPEVAERTGFVHMGVAADLVATMEGVARPALDALAIESHRRAARAQAEGRHARSLVPIIGGGEVLLDRDELLRPELSLADVAELEPLFGGEMLDGFASRIEARLPGVTVEPRHSVATSPGVADAAACMIVASEACAMRLGRAPRGRIVAAASASVDPVVMLTGNVEATRRALGRAQLDVGDVDVFEVNESFAVVPIHFARLLGVDMARMAPNGGALSLGHPLGATGGVLACNALDELERTGGRYAVLSICGAGGVATAVVVERLG